MALQGERRDDRRNGQPAHTDTKITVSHTGHSSKEGNNRII